MSQQYYDIVMINTQTNEVHTTSRLKSQCNIANPGQSGTKHHFKLIRCTSESEMRGNINSYVHGQNIRKNPYSLCMRCFPKNVLEDPIKLTSPSYDDIAFKNINTGEVHTTQRLTSNCLLTIKNPVENPAEGHFFHIWGYKNKDEEEVLNILTNQDEKKICSYCFKQELEEKVFLKI